MLHIYTQKNFLITRSWDFPGGSVVKNLPPNAGDAGSIPGQGTKIPHAVGQLRPRATTTEPTRRKYRAHALWSLHTTTREKPEKPTCYSEELACCNERRAATKTQCGQK